MKLFYGRQLLVDLGIRNPEDYGFDTFQFKNLDSTAGLSDIREDVNTIDGFFDENFDFVLSLKLNGEPLCGPNSGSGARGSIDRDPWYDNANSTYYSRWDAIFDLADTAYGTRFKGLRWNHEYRPRLFTEGPKWVAYAETNASEDYRDVQDNHLNQWRYYLDNIAQTHARDAYYDEGEALKPPYDGLPYAAVKRLYRHFVDFQCRAEARMVDLLANRLGSSKTLIIYPAYQTGHVDTPSEYTLNTHMVTASNVVREIGTWDTHDYDNAKRNSLASAQGSRSYFFVIQQGVEDRPSPASDRIDARAARMPGNIRNCLNPGEGEDPWNRSFAFWNSWKKDDPELKRRGLWITEQEQRNYMDKVSEGLS